MNIQSILILLGVVCFAGMAVAAMVRRRKDSDPCKGCINSGACHGGCNVLNQNNHINTY